eukprot:jgi/Undpi1/10311/HiC_scaffold_28.g12762.m1
MNSTARGPRSRWVGPPVPAPKSKPSRSPFGRQRHYGAVELAGASEQVNVNDVVEVTEKKQQQEPTQQHPALVQVLSMWEDTFTGVFKFRARWLVQASDLPANTLRRLRKSRQACAVDHEATGRKTSSNKVENESDEVFLTNKVRDLEVRAIVKPIMLCVSASTTTAVSPGRKDKMGPLLTHAFCDKSGDFYPLEGTDPILKRARVRQANAVALASRADQETEAAKSGKPIVKSNGWLLPKRGVFQRRSGRESAREAVLGIDIVKPSLNKTERPVSPPIMKIAMSDDSGTEEPPNSEDGEWNEREDDDDDGMDPDSPKNSRANLSVWRSIQDWDSQSRGMLAGYLHAAKGVVEAKQASPGVAVHVRFGGKNNSGVDKEENTGIASSFAVWAISSGRETCGLVRVACSEMAKTDIPKSAIQRVQSEEQALSALVKARCVLDNFEPALQMLKDDPGSPESIEPWTLEQVRTLEKALADDYDPNRRLHGWARPGMDMDREDFIDLADVSEQVPGKTPAQVLSFYYRYLAAAEPLTDVVYGLEAAKARKEEEISTVHEVDAVLHGDEGLTRRNAQQRNLKTVAKPVSPATHRVSPANTPADATKAASKPKPRVVRLSAPKPAQPVVKKPEPKDGTIVDSVPKSNRSTERPPSPPGKYTVSPVTEAMPTPHSLAVSEHATSKSMVDGDNRTSNSERGTTRDSNKRSKQSAGGGVASDYFAQQRRCAMREREASRTLPPVPPDAEVVEVEDSDDADAGGTNDDLGRPASGGGEPTRPSDMDVAARHINSMGQEGLSWVARQMRRQAVPAIVRRPVYRTPTESRGGSGHRCLLRPGIMRTRGGSMTDLEVVKSMVAILLISELTAWRTAAKETPTLDQNRYRETICLDPWPLAGDY